MPYQTPAQLAAIRPVDIVDQAMFDDMLASIPRPIPPEWQDQFRRLNAISRRHGFAWPYMRRTRTNSVRPTLTPTPTHTFTAPRPTQDAKPDLPPEFSFNKPAGQSYGHIAFRADREYFQYHDSYVYSAPREAPFDAEGYRTGTRLEGSFSTFRLPD